MKAIPSLGSAHRAVLFAYDVPRDANCIPQQVGSDTLCVGLAAHSREYSSSATCDLQDVARYYEPDGCAEPNFILKHTPAADACDPDELTLYTVASEIDASSVYEESGGNCSAVSSSSGPYYREGAMAPDGYVPTFSQTTLGTGRLQVDVYSSPGGALLGYVQPARFRDTARDEDCSPRSLEDGSWRCLPGSREIGASGTHYFADAACTTELLAVSQSACGTTPAYGAYRVANPQGCGTVTSAMHTVGALFTGDVYEGDADGSNCVAPASQPTDLDFYQLGAEVPPTDFVELTLATKPVQ